MVAYAAKLSEGFRFVRVDLSFANEKIYFGELTFYPLGGIYKFKPISLDHKLGFDDSFFLHNYMDIIDGLKFTVHFYIKII